MSLRRLPPWMAGAGRVSVFFLVLFVLLLVPLVHQARAALDGRFLEFGASMMRYSDAFRQDDPRPLRINGQQLFMSVGTTDDTVEEVLSAYESRCMARDGRTADAIHAASGRKGLPKDMDLRLFDGTLRHDEEDRGFVACLDMGEERVGVMDLLARIDRFFASGDISDVGRLRYVFAEKGHDRTRFVAFWSEGSLRPLEMFPEAGDAPGIDFPHLPRPEGSRRILSAWEEGELYGISVYAEIEGDVPSARRAYEAKLVEAGWHVLDTAALDAKSPALLASRQGKDVVVVFCGDGPTRSLASVVVRN